MNTGWENIAGDLLRRIEERLIWCADKVRLRCVCKSWQSQVSRLSRFQHPLLLLSSDEDGASFEFCDITDNKTYHLDLRKLQDFDTLSLHGSFHGWVIATAFKGSNSSLFMFNPLAGLKKHLSSRPRNRVIWKCIVSSNPSLTDDYMVVAISPYPTLDTLLYTKGVDNKWNKIPFMDSVTDIIFYQGRLYCLTPEAQLFAIEIGSSNPQVFPISSPRVDGTHWMWNLVDSCVGLLMVGCISHGSTRRFNVYKFDFEEGRWSTNLTDIGDVMLFFVFGNYGSVSLKHVPHAPAIFRPNHIYFFEAEGCSDNAIMRVFDLKTDRFEELLAFKNHNFRTSVWFIPPIH